MKAATIFLVGVGLVSAASVSPAPAAVDGGQIDPNVFSNSSSGFGSAADESDTGSSASSGLNLDPNLDLQGLDVSGLDLGNVNFNDQDDILNAVQLMANALCLGGLVQSAQLQQLGQVAQLEMFLQLAQLMNLAQSGLINLSEIQGLASTGLLLNGFNVGGVLKREAASHKKTTRRRQGRRASVKRQACQAGSIVSADAVGGQVVPGAVGASGAPAVAGAVAGAVSPVLAPAVIGGAA